MTDDALKKLEKEFGLLETPQEKVKKYVPYIVSSICLIFVVASLIASMEKPQLVGLAVYDENDTFGAETVVISIGGYANLYPAVAVRDEAGTYHIVWQRNVDDAEMNYPFPDTFETEDWDIYYSQSSNLSNGSSWTSPRMISVDNPNGDSNRSDIFPDISVGEEGVVWVVWQSNRFLRNESAGDYDWHIFKTNCTSSCTSISSWSTPVMYEEDRILSLQATSDKTLFGAYGYDDINPAVDVDSSNMPHISWQTNYYSDVLEPGTFGYPYFNTTFNGNMNDWDWEIMYINEEIATSSSNNSILVERRADDSDEFPDIVAAYGAVTDDVHIVWHGEEDTYRIFYENETDIYTQGLTNLDWDAVAIKVNDSITSYDDMFPQIDANLTYDGDLFVAWQSDRDDNFLANTYPFYCDPAPGLSGFGRVNAADSNWTIYRANSTDYGNSWSTGNFTGTDTSRMHPSIAVDEYEVPHLSYQKLLDPATLDWEIIYKIDSAAGKIIGEYNISVDGDTDSYPTLDTGMEIYNHFFYNKIFGWHSDRISPEWGVYEENDLSGMDFSAVINLTLSDETDSITEYEYSQIDFYANYTNKITGQPITGAGTQCTFTENSTGSWSSGAAMPYNATLGLYEYNKSFDTSGSHNFNATCSSPSFGSTMDTEPFTVTSRGTINYTEFDGNDTTEFDTIEDPDEIYGATLENSNGMIVWDGPVTAVGQDFDANVEIGQGFVDVDSNSLHSSFNSSATITLYNINDLVYPVILIDGVMCSPSVCSVTSYSNGNLTFTVTHFTNYTAAEGTQLTIWDTTDSKTRYEYHQIRFYANFSNITDSQPIQGSGAYCQISSNYTGWTAPVSMTYNATSSLYEYNRSFANAGNFTFNVTCNGTNLGFAVLNLSDNLNITHDPIEPNTESVEIVSANQNRSDGDITCRANVTDNARENMYVYNTWYRNGTYYSDSVSFPAPNNTLTLLSTIGSNNINRDETWTCEVFADDWVNNESDQNNATIVIRNSLPVPTVTVNSSDLIFFVPLEEDILCWASGYDKDGDSMTAYYQWYNESVAVAGLNGSTPLSGTTLVATLSSNYTGYDEKWTCGIILFDGLENGTEVNDSIEVIPRKNIYMAEEIAPDVSAFEPTLPTGLTTNFSINLVPDIENYSNAILKNEYGKVEFAEPVDFTKLNLSRDIEISYNNFTINISELSGLNVSSNIELFNLTLVYPEVWKGSETCSLCHDMSYTVGILYFEVDGFEASPLTTLYGIELAPDVSAFDDSTDFSWASSLDIENVPDVYVQNSPGSRIDFLEPINATLLNLSKYITLKFRNATIDTSNASVASRLDKPARILFYNESLIYPLILRNGVRCKDECTYISRTSLAFLINVTGFNLTNQTSYTLAEGAPIVTLFNGSLTTDFTRPSIGEFDFDIEAMSDVVLEKPDIGKIEFNEIINVSAGNLDWDSNADIINNGPSGKYVSINTTILPNLNKSADITLYDLSLVYPEIWYLNSTGGLETCPSEICTIISYPSSPENCKDNASCELVFNVTRFSTYWAMENDPSPRFIYPLGDQIWYENRNNTIVNLSSYVFDPDNNTLYYDLTTNCTNITTTINSETNVLFVPDNDWVGSCVASFNVSDGENDVIENITLTVIANIPPQFANGPITLASWNEDETATLNLSYYFWDPDNDTLEFGYQFLASEDINVSIEQATGVATLTPDENWYGENYIRFYAEDEKAITYSAPYTTLIVVSVNDVPAIDFNIPDNTKNYITIDEDTTHSIYLPNHFTDVEDNDWDITYYLNSTPVNFNVTFNSTAYAIFVPDENWNGYESFIIVANDSDGGTGQSNAFIIYVNAMPDSVHLVDAGNNTAYFEWPEDTNYTFDVSPWFEDDDNDSIYYYEQSSTSQIAVNLGTLTGAGTFSPAEDFAGVEIINFTATDGSALVTIYATCNVTNADDDAPVFNGPILDQSWNEDENHTLNLSLYFTDPDVTPLTYTVISSPANIAITINSTTGIATFVPDADWFGTQYVTFRATDTGNNTVDSDSVTLVVLNVTDVPRLTQTIPNQNWAKNTNKTLDLNDYFTDPEGDPLSFTSTTPDNITVYITNITGITKLEPEADFVGINYIEFTAYDTTGNNVTSNNVTLSIVEGPSYLIDTYVDGVFYDDENSTNITGIIISNLTDSNITNSNLYYCVVTDSTILNSNGTDCEINNSILRNCEVGGALCTTKNWEITSGYITFNGSTYNASAGSGTENLTDLINYPPIAGFSAPSSAEPSESVSFTDTSIDYNIPATSPGVPGEGLLNDNLTYFWDFDDGSNSTLQNVTHSYTTKATYTVSLTVTDDFGESDTFTKSIQIKTTPSGGSTGGGGGGGTARCTEKWNCTKWDECTPYDIQYRTCYDDNLCGTAYFKPAETQACDYTPTCSDYVVNQDESDTDCGGSCPPCVDGRLCLSDSDCINSCFEGLCTTIVEVEEERPVLPPPPPVEKPAKVSIFQKEVLGVSLWVYLIAVVAAGTLIVGGLFVGKQKARKIGEMPTYSYLDSLKAAIKRDIVRGVPEGHIRGALLDIGWPRYLVDQAMREINKAMLKEPVKSDIVKGYDELKLKKALVGKGWPTTTVDEVIEDVNMSILRNAMKTNVSRGFTADKVGEGMVGKGWPKEAVNKVVKEFKTAK